MSKVSRKKHVLLLQETLVPYRFPIYNIIAKHFDFSVAFLYKAKGCEKQTANFELIQFESFSIKGVHWIRNLKSLCKHFDAVITLPHLRCLNFCTVPFRYQRSFAALTWSIGVRASYNRAFSIKEKLKWSDYIYERIMKECEANIFYTQVPIEKWVKRGLDRNKFFVAHNTVEVYPIEYSPNNRNSILFVGTLYPQKGTDLLIKAYASAKDLCKSDDFPILEIVGDGTQKEELKSFVNSLGINDSVRFYGGIFDEFTLSQIFSKAIICISPRQAGLSVLKSMGYGVPYVTQEDAITGGEIFNIKNGENGVIYDSPDRLSDIIYDAYVNISKYKIMGKAAYDYYHRYSTPQIMADGVIAAVEYALLKKSK